MLFHAPCPDTNNHANYFHKSYYHKCHNEGLPSTYKLKYTLGD